MDTLCETLLNKGCNGRLEDHQKGTDSANWPKKWCDNQRLVVEKELPLMEKIAAIRVGG